MLPQVFASLLIVSPGHIAFQPSIPTTMVEIVVENCDAAFELDPTSPWTQIIVLPCDDGKRVIMGGPTLVPNGAPYPLLTTSLCPLVRAVTSCDPIIIDTHYLCDPVAIKAATWTTVKHVYR